MRNIIFATAFAVLILIVACVSEKNETVVRSNENASKANKIQNENNKKTPILVELFTSEG